MSDNFLFEDAEIDKLTHNGFLFEETKNGIIITEYHKETTNIVIPDIINDKKVIEIAPEAFTLCYSTETIEIPNTVTKIGNSAFRNCKKLTYIEIPDSVTKIESHAFYNCNALLDIKLPKNITKISNYLFCECSNLSTIAIPKGVTEIGSHAFFNCKNLSNVEILEGVTEIGSHAFCRCKNLLTIEIPEGVTKIAASAFSGCYKIANIEIPKSVTVIDKNAFEKFSNSTTIKCFSNSIVNDIFDKEIPYDLIHNFLNIDFKKFNDLNKKVMCLYFVENKQLDLEKTVLNFMIRNEDYFIEKFIESKNTKSLQYIISLTNPSYLSIKKYIDFAKDKADVEINAILLEKNNMFTTSDKQRALSRELNKNPYAVDSMKKLWQYKSKNKQITLIKYLGTETKIDIPPIIGKTPVTAIGKEVFYQTANVNHREITNISIPNSVTSIGEGSFKDLKNLIEIEVPESVTEISDSAFLGCSNLLSALNTKN